MKRRFSISYFSEISAVITLTASDGYLRAKGVHPSKLREGYDVDLLPNWFHFSHGSGVDRYDTDNDFEGDLTVQHLIDGPRREAVLKTLDVVADELWPGPRPLMQDNPPPGVVSEEEMRQHFRQVVLYAYITGRYHPANGVHQLGKRHWIDEWVEYDRKI